MKFYLFAIKFYKNAIFSSKKTFTQMVPWILTPIDKNTAAVMVLSGQRTDQLEPSFFTTGAMKIPISQMSQWMEVQLGEFKSAKRETQRVEIIEDLNCRVNVIDKDTCQITFVEPPKPKYMSDFILKYQLEVSKQYNREVYTLDGDLKIDDFVSDTFNPSKIKQRINFSNKFLKFRGWI